MFNNVHKSLFLQDKFKNIRLTKFDLDNKMLLTLYT